MNQPATIDEYMQPFSSDVQAILQTIRNTIQQNIPEAKEAIKYGIPTFVFKGKNVAHFGAFKHHIGFYPTPQGIAEFEKELSHYKQAKGSVQFPLTKPMPIDLIKRIVLFRLNKVKGKNN